jgi:hypothetical protein
MEQVSIKNRIFTFSKSFKDEKERASHNALTRQTYGFDFEQWYQSGYWKDNFIPYMLLDGESVVSSILVSLITFSVLGSDKKAVQLGTVMTDTGYRNLGLNRFLMERILSDWQANCDVLYLYANDSVLNYYPKFGFLEAHEYQYSKMIINGNGGNVTQLDMTRDENRVFLFNKITSSVPVSKISMRKNAALPMFHCTSFMNQNIYFIEKLDTIAVAEFSEDTLYLYDVFSPQNVPLQSIIDEMARSSIKKVIFGFTPLDTEFCEASIVKEEDTTLFILGDTASFLKNNQLMFPVLSRT